MIPHADLKIATVSQRPPGGQHVGVHSGVEITHIPTGTVAVSHMGRSQHHNREIAMDMILAALTHPHA